MLTLPNFRLLVRLCFLTCMLVASPVFAQVETLSGAISVDDSVAVSVVSAFPDEFPNVSVVFRALRPSGAPVFGLQKAQMRVTEGAKDVCEVISLIPLNDEKPVNIGIVIDHSGSMIFDPNTAFFDDGSVRVFQDTDGAIYMDPTYTPPIEHAKSAVIQFMRGFDVNKDFMSVIGFSVEVDVVEPLTQDTTRLANAVRAMQPDFSTALYDAMLTAINEISDADGVRVLVVLTDGNDNASMGSIEDVVNMAEGENIPIYLIGLGEVNTELLASISEATGGRFYHTQSAEALTTIYAAIQADIQSFYELVYTSPNLAFGDTVREFRLTFESDSLLVKAGEGSFRLPADVQAYLQTKARERTYTLYGGIAIAALLASGVLVYVLRRRKDAAPKLTKLYPNPATNRITIESSSTDGDLVLFDGSGAQVMRFDLRQGERSFDVSGLPRGQYVAVIESKTARSAGVKVVLN